MGSVSTGCVRDLFFFSMAVCLLRPLVDSLSIDLAGFDFGKVFVVAFHFRLVYVLFYEVLPSQLCRVADFPMLICL